MAKLALANVLKKKKISKREFARRLGMRYDNSFRYFRPGYDPKLSVLSRWAAALECKVRDLFKE